MFVFWNIIQNIQKISSTSCSTYSSETNYSFLLRLLIIPQISKAATHASPCPIADTCFLLLHFHKHMLLVLFSLRQQYFVCRSAVKVQTLSLFFHLACFLIQTPSPAPFFFNLVLEDPSLSSSLIMFSQTYSYTILSRAFPTRTKPPLQYRMIRNVTVLEDNLKKLKLWSGFQKN